MKRIISVLLIFTLIPVVLFSMLSFSLRNDSTFEGADSSGTYVVNYSGRNAQIYRYGSRNCSASLNLSYPISSAIAYHGKIVLFCDDTKNNQLIVYVYYLDTDSLDSFAIY